MIINNHNAQHQAIALILLPVRTVCRPLARRGTGLMQGRDPGVSRPRGPKMTGPQPGAPFWDTGSTGSTGGGGIAFGLSAIRRCTTLRSSTGARRGEDPGLWLWSTPGSGTGDWGEGRARNGLLQHRRRQSRSGVVVRNGWSEDEGDETVMRPPIGGTVAGGSAEGRGAWLKSTQHAAVQIKIPVCRCRCRWHYCTATYRDGSGGSLTFGAWLRRLEACEKGAVQHHH